MNFELLNLGDKMRKNLACVFSFLMCISTFAIQSTAQTADSVAKFTHLYESGSAPLMADLDGWYSGNCFHTDPTGFERGAVLVFKRDLSSKQVKFFELDNPKPNAYATLTPKAENEVNTLVQQLEPHTKTPIATAELLAEPVCINGPGDDRMSPYTHGAYFLLKKSGNGFAAKIVSLGYSSSCQVTINPGTRTKGYCYFDKKVK
jgi:hypothetical protein